MAVTNSIPPQAYTRDVLVKAIEWMQTQPQSLREKATSADLLVSYYMQACRRTAVSQEAPVSQENFKADLKHLAEGLKQFEEPIAPPPQHAGRFPSYGQTAGIGHGPQVHGPIQASIEPLFTPQSLTDHSYVPNPPPPPPLKPPALQWTIDAKSLAAARDLQHRLNLSNEGEAIRMLITLGAQRARDMFSSLSN